MSFLTYLFQIQPDLNFRVVTENFTARHLMLKALNRIQGQNSFAFIGPSLRTTSEVRGWEKTMESMRSEEGNV